MRQAHVPEEKLFVDYAGKTMPYIDPNSGEPCVAQIFVATMGFSNFTYVETCCDQKLPSWIHSHEWALAFFGGVPQVIVRDNLKAAVRKAHRYDPELNRTYRDLGEHYNVELLPTRIYRPGDKSFIHMIAPTGQH